jgi:hypothetical protein
LQELDRYQLPYGIAHDNDVFLFRERYDRSHRKPFKGLRIAHTIEPQATWNKILEAAGAVVVPLPQDDRVPHATVDLLLRPDLVIVDPLRSAPSLLPDYLRKRLRSEASGLQSTLPLVLSVDWLAACLGSNVFLEPDSASNFWAQLEPVCVPFTAVLGGNNVLIQACLSHRACSMRRTCQPSRTRAASGSCLEIL